ncbi:MAG TPA: beta-L-arabinofuranosidase domain-containing protein [Trebonia sp.]|jgi:DUF1680 family protein|nr:beta-L-arabinofuranosidase domain-containing protein [Trebonia sp.]
MSDESPDQVLAPAVGGPAVPTKSSITVQRPLDGPGARLTGGLLHDWQRRNAAASMPLALRHLETAGNLDNLRLALRVAEDSAAPDSSAAVPAAPEPGQPGQPGGPAKPENPRRLHNLGPVDPIPGLGYQGPVFMDSDVHKTLEAIGWELAGRPDPALADFAARTIGLLGQVQRPDGYLNSYVQVSGEPRYSRLAMSHEMYCAGHLIQAAIALSRSDPDGAPARDALAIATRLADHLVREFGGQAKALDGHPVIETALVELYRETGTRAYLDLAAQFVDQRGHGLAGDSGLGRRYLQDHEPVRDSVTVVGHAVRALYLEAGVTDVATETQDAELLASSARRWDDMVAAKTYLTGGNGSRHVDEGFGDRFELPPDRAYNETCAAIASFQWSWRLLLATGDAKYADLMERVLYNGFAASIAAEGDRFFYVNPLQRREDHFEKDDPGRRREWFSCACCPPNIMRLLASLHHYLAATDGDTLYVHQYATARLSGAELDVELTTGYPWTGEVTIRVLGAPAEERELALRIPAWCSSASWSVNDSPSRSRDSASPYLRLRRVWSPGDELRLSLDMTPRWTRPDPRVDAARGCVAIERGPLVYCFEQADQGVRLDEVAVTTSVPLTERETSADGIGGTIQVIAHAVPVSGPADAAADGAGATVVAIPYFQWDNRGPGTMRVWIPGFR